MMQTITSEPESPATKPESPATKRATPVFKSLIHGLLGLIALSIPLFFSTITAQGLMFDKQMMFTALTLIVFILWIVAGAKAGRLEVRRTPIDVFVLVAFAVMLASALFSISMATSFLGAFGSPTVGVLGAVTALLFFFAAVSNVRSVVLAKSLGALFAIAGGVALLFALLQSLGVYLVPVASFRQATVNTLGAPIVVALFAAALFPVSLSYFSLAKGALRRIGWGAMTLLTLFTLILFNYTTTWIALIVGVGLLFVLWTGRRLSKAPGIVGMLALAFALAVFFLAARGLNLQFGLALQVPAQVSLSQATSFDIAKQALTDHFALGTGPGTYGLAFTQYRPAILNGSLLWNVRFNEPVSFVWEIFTTLGVLGTLALLLIVGSIYYLGFRWFVKAHDAPHCVLGMGVFTSLCVLGVAAFLSEFNATLLLAGLFLLVLFFAFMAHDWPRMFSERKPFLKVSTEPSLRLSAALLASIAVVALTFTFLVRIFVADVVAAKALAGSDAATGVTKLARAAQLVPWRDTYLSNIAALSLVALQQEAAKAKPEPKVIKGAVANAVQAALALTNAAGDSAASWQMLGSVYETVAAYVTDPTEALTRAKTAYQKASKLEPTNPADLVALANIDREIYAATAKEDRTPDVLKDAQDNLTKALSLKADYAGAFASQGLLAETQGKLDDAITSYTKAVNIANTVDNAFQLGRLLYNRAVSNTPQTDDLNNAEAILVNVVKNAPKFANGQFSLALVYEKEGKVKKAKAQLTALLNQLTDEKSKKLVQQRLDALGLSAGQASGAAPAASQTSGTELTAPSASKTKLPATTP